MKKTLSTKWSITGLFILFGCTVIANNAGAITGEFELIDPDPLVGQPSYTPGTDLGYYIWVDDAARFSWHIRWSGDGPDTYYTGDIQLIGNEFDSYASFSFDNHSGSIADATTVFPNNQSSTFFAIANVSHDGIDFTLNNFSSPSFVAFDLNVNGFQSDGTDIFLGSTGITPASLDSDGDFKITAPVPEPATMLFFGTGLAGIAGIQRRKNKS